MFITAGPSTKLSGCRFFSATYGKLGADMYISQSPENILKTYSDSCRSATKIQSAVNKTVVLTRDAARMEKLPRKSHVIIIIKVVDLEGEHD